MITKDFTDVTRVDPSLAKGMLKRMVREHREHGTNIMETERALRATGHAPGSRRAGPHFKRNKEIVLNAMGCFVAESVCLTSSRGKQHAEIIVGLDPIPASDLEALPIVVVFIDKKKMTVRPTYVNAAVSYHALERVLERHQLRDVSQMWKYAVQLIWGAYSVAACQELTAGTYWVYLQSGMAIVDRDDAGYAKATTWVPKELYSVQQQAFFNTFDADDISALITNSTFTNRTPIFRRKVKFAGWKPHAPYVVLFEDNKYER